MAHYMGYAVLQLLYEKIKESADNAARNSWSTILKLYLPTDKGFLTELDWRPLEGVVARRTDFIIRCIRFSPPNEFPAKVVLLVDEKLSGGQEIEDAAWAEAGTHLTNYLMLVRAEQTGNDILYAAIATGAYIRFYYLEPSEQMLRDCPSAHTGNAYEIKNDESEVVRILNEYAARTAETPCPSPVCAKMRTYTLKGLFRNAISALNQRQFTCFIDALDECDQQQVIDIVESFEDLAEHVRENDIPFRICLSSRHYPDMVPKRGIRLTLENQPGHADDLATYITSHLGINNQELIEELKLGILSKAAALRKKLAQIPSDLNKLFKEILTHNNKNMGSLLLCIRWILFAARPLQPEEFRHALWSGLSLKNMTDSQIPAPIHAEDRHSLDMLVISSSKDLAEIIESEPPTVQFIHDSVRDFLLNDNGLRELWPGLETDWESSSHEELKQCCEFYLNQPQVSSSVDDPVLSSNPSMQEKIREEIPNFKHPFQCQSHEAFKESCKFYLSHTSIKRSIQEEIRKEYPFLKYATQNILYHANAAAEVVPQAKFLSNFPRRNWIKMNNLFEKHVVREYTSSARRLYILADKGCSNLVRLRIKEDPQVPIRGERYRYPIFAALAGGHKATIAALLNPASIIDDDGVDFTQDWNNMNAIKGYQRTTPLSWAARNGHLGIAKCLLDRGCDIDEIDGKDRTALAWASENGYLTMAKFLIDRGAGVDARSLSGSSPLLYASHNGHFEIVELLLNKGADVNTRTCYGWTPLSYASRNVHAKMVELLINNGADADDQSQPLLHVLRADCSDAMKLPIDERDHLKIPTLTNLQTIVRLLIANGADMNAKDSCEYTPLSYASQKGYVEIVELLIKKGVDINAHMGQGVSPLIEAMRMGHRRIARLLIDNGADFNALDRNVYSPLLFASQKGYIEIVELLIDKGADVNVNNGIALQYAMVNSHEEIAIFLIHKGVDVNNPSEVYSQACKRGYEKLARVLIDKGYISAMDLSLVFTAEKGYCELVELLLIYQGADVNSYDYKRRTALIWASGNGHETMARLLIDNGAHVDFRDQMGRTALDWASKSGHQEMTRLLIDYRQRN